MRLIDENVLLKEFKALISAYRQIEGKHNWGDHCRIPAFEFMDALKSAKTIDAVDIAWLLGWVVKNEAFDENGSIGWFYDMIEEWRKENEETVL